jgi:hypothetical protein
LNKAQKLIKKNKTFLGCGGCGHPCTSTTWSGIWDGGHGGASLMTTGQGVGCLLPSSSFTQKFSIKNDYFLIFFMLILKRRHI